MFNHESDKFLADLSFSHNLIPNLGLELKQNNIFFLLFNKLTLISIRKKKKNIVFSFNYYFFFYLKTNTILNFALEPKFYFFDSNLLICSFFNILNVLNHGNYNLVFYPKKTKDLKNLENFNDKNARKNIKNTKNIVDVKNIENSKNFDISEDSFIFDFFKAYTTILIHSKVNNNFSTFINFNKSFKNNNFKDISIRDIEIETKKNNKYNNNSSNKKNKTYEKEYKNQDRFNNSIIDIKQKDFDFNKKANISSVTYSLYDQQQLPKNNTVANINKAFKLINDLLWFFFFIQNIKESLFFILKSCFFEFIFRYSDLKNKVSLFFYETSDLKFLTSSLISNYIIRNLRVGNTLIRIISPLLNHLKKSPYIYKGWKIGCFGRFQRRGRAQHLWFGKKGVPLNTLISCVDFFKSIIRLRNGLCCVKVFVVKANIYIYIF